LEVPLSRRRGRSRENCISCAGCVESAYVYKGDIIPQLEVAVTSLCGGRQNCGLWLEVMSASFGILRWAEDGATGASCMILYCSLLGGRY
jgi:hypothetical protein